MTTNPYETYHNRLNVLTKVEQIHLLKSLLGWNSSLFIWKEQPENYNYWSDVYEILNGLDRNESFVSKETCQLIIKSHGGSSRYVVDFLIGSLHTMGVQVVVPFLEPAYDKTKDKERCW